MRAATIKINPDFPYTLVPLAELRTLALLISGPAPFPGSSLFLPFAYVPFRLRLCALLQGSHALRSTRRRRVCGGKSQPRRGTLPCSFQHTAVVHKCHSHRVTIRCAARGKWHYQAPGNLFEPSRRSTAASRDCLARVTIPKGSMALLPDRSLDSGDASFGWCQPEVDCRPCQRKSDCLPRTLPVVCAGSKHRQQSQTQQRDL